MIFNIIPGTPELISLEFAESQRFKISDLDNYTLVLFNMHFLILCHSRSKMLIKR